VAEPHAPSNDRPPSRYHPYGQRPKNWWMVSIGGAPRWLLMVSGLMLIASGIVIIIGISGR
jgi:hypothetical protein